LYGQQLTGRVILKHKGKERRGVVGFHLCETIFQGRAKDLQPWNKVSVSVWILTDRVHRQVQTYGLLQVWWADTDDKEEDVSLDDIELGDDVDMDAPWLRPVRLQHICKRAFLGTRKTKC
jgi:hypothetical protein